jgi:PAS domain S-box-containing protein
VALTPDSLNRIGRHLRLQNVVLEHAANGIVITDPAGSIVWVNHAFTSSSGYSPADVVGRNPRILRSGEHDRDFYANLWTTVIAGGTWRGEITNRRKDGSLYVSDQTIVPVVSTDGSVSHLVAIMNDVTARRRAESDLESTRAQLRQVLEQRPAVTYRMQILKGAVSRLTVNDEVEKLLGFSAAQASDAGWWLGQLHPAERDRVGAELLGAQVNETTRSEYRLGHLDGSYRWIEDHRRLVPGTPGQPAELVGVWNDITERKRAEAMVNGAAVRKGSRGRRGILRDELILAGACGLVFLTAEKFTIFSNLFDVVGRGESLVDNAIGTLVFLSLGLVALLYRRWRESQDQIEQQMQVTAAMSTLHADLEMRMQRRTSELTGTQQTLRAEIAARKRAEDSAPPGAETLRTAPAPSAPS